MKKGKSTILEGPVFPAMTAFALPILCSLILQALYGAVDLWMVSQFGTNADVSAVSTGSQTMLIITGIITGLAMGITILLGQAVGQRNERKSADIIGTGIWIFMFMTIVLTVLLITGASFIASSLHAPAEAFIKTVWYIRICGGATVFIVGFNVLNAIFCGLGDSKTPLVFVGTACLINIAGDYILIEKVHLGAEGAAIATAAAQAFSVVCALLLLKRKLPFQIKKENLRFRKKIAGNILKLGIPVALLRMCNEISYLVILGFVNTLGVVASSGVGIAEKLVMFILLIPTAYMSSVSAFAAQNMGAGNEKRMKKSLWSGMGTAAVIGGVAAYVSFFHGDVLSKFFINDPEVICASSEFLKATAIECFVLSLAYCYDGYFNGTGKTTFVMVQGIAAALLVRIPYAYYASTKNTPELFDIGMAAAYAAIFMFFACSIYYIVQNKKRHV